MHVNQATREAFNADPMEFLKKHGCDFAKIQALRNKDRAEFHKTLLAVGYKGKVTAKTKWFGVALLFDEEATQSLIDGTMDATELAAAIAGALSLIPAIDAIAAAAAAILAAALLLEKMGIKWADKGKGVHFNLYWSTVLAITSMTPVLLLPDLIPLSN